MSAPSVLDRTSGMIADAVRDEHEGAEEAGPNRVALACERSIAELEAEKRNAPRSQRRLINQRLSLLRDMLAWCKTRAGYTLVSDRASERAAASLLTSTVPDDGLGAADSALLAH